MKPLVAYASYCCPKDQDRVLARAQEHVASHKYPFDVKYFVFQRCPESLIAPEGFNPIRIADSDYPEILHHFGIQWPDPVLDELTHGWSASHFWAHHVCNHVAVLRQAQTDYIVFADGDCFISETPESGPSWVEKGIELLENNPDLFVVCPSDGGEERREIIMSQQMFLINRKRFLEMEFIPWDGKFIDGGPMQEWYGMLEGKISRYMMKNNLFRYVLPQTWRWYHLGFH